MSRFKPANAGVCCNCKNRASDLAERYNGNHLFDKQVANFEVQKPFLFWFGFSRFGHCRQLGLKPKPPIRTAEYDAFQLPLKTASDAWMQELHQQGTPLKLGVNHQASGLIVDLSHHSAGEIGATGLKKR